jgi:hypothetical protein
VRTFDLGDAVPLLHRVYNASGTAVNADVVLSVVRPDGTTETVAVTNPETGRYEALYIPAVTGIFTYVWVVSGAVTDVVPGSWMVADPAPPAYAGLPLVKLSLGKLSSDDRDELIAARIRQSARRIDKRCGRRFYRDRAASPRVFSPSGRTLVDSAGDTVLLVPDIATADGLIVETGSASTGWTPVTGWEIGPDEALVDGWPITEIRGPRGWVPEVGRARLTAVWGWPWVPDDVEAANELHACRLYRRKDSPQGVLGNSEWGTARVSRLDPDVEDLLSPYLLTAIA